MKNLIQSYTFNPLLKTITINDYPYLDLENILIITNVTSNIIIYNFADITLGGTIVGNILTLDYDVTAMVSTDSLQIYVDVPIAETVYEQYPITEQFTYDTNLSQVLGSQLLVDNGNLKTKTIFADYILKSKISSANEQFGINTQGCPTGLIQISGTWSGTISFEAFADGGNFVAINGSAINGTALVTSTTTNGIFRFNTAGIIRLQARFSAYTSGAASISLIASGESAGVFLSNAVNGSQSQPISQKASTFESNTFDTNLSTVLGNVALWRQGFTGLDLVQSPTVNPTQPTSYTPTMFSKYPQILPRLRVEIGGDQKLPIAQEQNTNKLMVSNDDARKLLEDILYQLLLFNQNFSIYSGLDTKLEYKADTNK